MDLIRKLLFLPEQGSEAASSIDGLHFFVIGVTMLGATAVALAALTFVARYRASSIDALPIRVDTSGSKRLRRGVELGLVGGLLGLFLLWWQIGYAQYLELTSAPRDSLQVYVVGKQWVWEFAYPDGPKGLGELTVPVGRPVQLLITSRDVIHSLFVPAFRIKMDAVPGRTTTIQFTAIKPGRYDVFCAEYCGPGHSRMRASVVVLSADEWDSWLRDRAPARRLQDGITIAATKGCLACHSLDGAPRTGPSWKDLYGSWRELADGTRVLADEGYLTESMMEPREKLVAGFEPVMPSYRGQLDPGEAAAIVDLIRNLGRSSREGVEGRRAP